MSIDAIADEQYVGHDFILFNGHMESILPSYYFEYIDLIVTSPPYSLGKDYGEVSDTLTYQEYLQQFEQWLAVMYGALTPGGRLCLNIPLDINVQYDASGKKRSQKTPLLYDVARMFTDDSFNWVYGTTILWLEGNVSKRCCWGSYLAASDPWINTAAEVVLVYNKETRKRDGKGKSSGITKEEWLAWTLGIWEFSGQHKKSVGGHPAAFPVELPKRLIKLFSFIGDVVCDPFSGSGSTGEAALKNDRLYIGIDTDKRYFDFSKQRLDRVSQDI